MCGRFTQKLTWSQIHDLYSLTASLVPLNLQPRYNGAPEQEFAACRLDDDGNRTMVQLRWGLVPSWTRDVRIATRLINARSETIHTKPSFGAALRFASMPGAGRWVVRVATDRVRQAALLFGA